MPSPNPSRPHRWPPAPSSSRPSRGATPAALQVQILATEHWSLLATRSQSWNESFARAQMFLSALAASVIALALVAQATGFGSGFTAFALVLLPVVLFLGLTTYIRLVAINHDETRWVLGMNRIRAAYLELAPELERWFITSHHDDERGAMVTAGLGHLPNPVRLCHHPGRGGGHRRRGRRRDRRSGHPCPRPPSPSGGGARRAGRCRVGDLALTAYSRWAYRRWREIYPPVSPTPETVH